MDLKVSTLVFFMFFIFRNSLDYSTRGHDNPAGPMRYLKVTKGISFPAV